jgi:hypothetical protein
MAHQKLKSGCKNRPGGALQLRLRQYSERPSGPSLCMALLKYLKMEYGYPMIVEVHQEDLCKPTHVIKSQADKAEG